MTMAAWATGKLAAARRISLLLSSALSKHALKEKRRCSGWMISWEAWAFMALSMAEGVLAASIRMAPDNKRETQKQKARSGVSTEDHSLLGALIVAVALLQPFRDLPRRPDKSPPRQNKK